MRRLLAITIIFVSLLCGCNDHNHTLSEAEEIMDEHPDSAYPPSKRSPSNSLIQITCEDGIIEICFLQDMGIVCCEVLNPATFESMTSVINTQVGTELIKLPDAYNTLS